MAENRQPSRNGKAPSLEIRFGGPSAVSTLESTHDTIATLHHRGTFWALAISSVCPMLFFDRSHDGVPHPCFLPTTVGLGGVSERAIRDHGLLHDRRSPPAVGCDPIISLINVPKACAAWRSDLGALPCPVFTNHPCLYIITPSPATPTDLPGLPQTTVVVEPSLFSLVLFLLRHLHFYCCCPLHWTC